MNTLARIFADYDLDLLQVIAAQWDLDLTVRERGAAAEELSEAMGDPDAVRETWERLSDAEQEALVELLNNGGRLLYSHFTRRFGELRPMGPARREREKPWLSPVSVTEALYYRGLIIQSFFQTEAGAQQHITIPADLIPHLPHSDKQSATRAPGYAVAPPRKLKTGHYAAADDIATLIAYLLLRKADAGEWLVNGPVEVIDRHLRRPDEYPCRALLTQLAYDQGLITDLDVLTHTETRVTKDAARPWLEAPCLHQLRALAETWRDSVTWNDLAYTPGLEADEWPNDPRLARQVVMAYLRQVPAEIWWSLDAFVEHIKAANPDFQRPGGDYAAWYLRDAYTGEILHGFQYWDHIEGALIRFIIEGPMLWLGLVRAARGALMLTRLGQAFLGRAEWPSDPDPPALIRMDDQGIITVPPELGRYERVQIARFAAWMEAPVITSLVPGQKEKSVYLYRLTAQSLQRAHADGITLSAHIIPFLQKLAGRDLPDNVLKMLARWQEEMGEVLVEDVVIVRAKNLGVYQQLRSNKRTNRWLGEQPGPMAHLVRREDMPALMKAIRDMGILPHFAGYEKDDWP